MQVHKKEKESNKSGSLEMCITWYNIFSSCEKYYTVVSCTDGHHAVIKSEFKIEKKKIDNPFLIFTLDIIFDSRLHVVNWMAIPIISCNYNIN